MQNLSISKVNANQINDFFDVYKKIANDDFVKWTPESKKIWFEKQYSPKFWSKLIQDGIPIFVAIHKKQMVGYVALEDINFGVAYLGWIGVLKDYQFSGIGSILMKEVEMWCKENHIHKIELETQEPELEHFYEKHGFVLESIRKNSWQNLDNYMFGKGIVS